MNQLKEKQKLSDDAKRVAGSIYRETVIAQARTLMENLISLKIDKNIIENFDDNFFKNKQYNHKKEIGGKCGLYKFILNNHPNILQEYQVVKNTKTVEQISRNQFYRRLNYIRDKWREEFLSRLK